MGIRIHQLPLAISNQIAAGEVIERPASVVKELLENSYDAGADAITIEIGYGGLNQIKISDNGSGIFAEDLPLAVAAHATSKITTLNDLYAIESMGFRGEALASISSVAKVTISSKPSSQEHAMMLQIKGSECFLSPCARNQGTTIDVIDLFFNAPVRKRFLKSEQLEFQAIETVVKRFALSAPHIALTLKHNTKLIFSLPAAANEKTKMARMTKIFGSAFAKEALFLEVERSGMHLYGWISGRNVQRSQNDRQWIYINQRMVKDKLIHHAIKQAYEGLLHPGRFPSCLLYFTMNAAEVDVNVHPTKHEVRFQQPRLIHDFFSSQITEALKIQFEEKSICLTSTQFAQESEVTMTVREPHSYSNYSRSPTSIAEKRSEFLRQDLDHISWIVLNSRFVLVFISNEPYVVDVIALQKDWLLKVLKECDLPLPSRPLLVPVNCFLPSKLQNKLEELKGLLIQLGIQFAVPTEETIQILSLPICVPYLDIKEFIESLAEIELIVCPELLTLICHSQRFDAHLLTNDERMELNQFLLSKAREAKHQTYFKSLTLDECRKLVHE